MKWYDLIESNKRKLKYMANILVTIDISVQNQIKRDFSEIEFKKIKSVLRKVTIQGGYSANQLRWMKKL